ncbi:MAG TPA: MG2 domain-containing protein, partial [Dehalococcoidia bacterium]|nr:MG2 domain-containing protein [Dehalococcoidia bacterium]
MKSKRTVVFAAIMAIILLGSALPACAVDKIPDGYTVVLPAMLQAGTRQKVSVSRLSGTAPATGRVTLALLKEGNEVARGSVRVSGTGTIDLNVPNVPEGDYTVRLSGSGFQDEAMVKVANSYLVFLETDKPIYKPGQTIHLRAVTLDPDLMPMSEAVTVEILDAKGIKVFRRAVDTDSYGMAALDLPLSDEPNLGVWKINASTPKNKTQLDVRVEEYVLPKYEVKVELPRDWFLVNEQIKGKVTAEYSFGKPVKGD